MGLQILLIKRSLRALLALVASFLAVAIVVPANVSALTFDWSISTEASSQEAANKRVDNMCQNGAPVGHAGYVHNANFNSNTGVLTWQVTTVNRRCSGGADVGGYAVTGYNGLCPLAGWYSGVPSTGADTYDCIKFSDPDGLYGRRKCSDGSWGGNPVNNCRAYGNWWPVVYGGGSYDQPPYYNVYRTYSFSGQIPNWKEAKLTSGSYGFIQGRELCGSWTLLSDWSFHGAEFCQYIDATIRWTAKWSVGGQSYVGTQGRVNGNNSDAKNRKQGEYAIRNVRPGQKVYWDHTLRNDGPDPMNQDVVIGINNIDYDLSNNSQISRNASPSNIRKRGTNGSVFYIYRNGGGRLVKQDDVGHRLCQQISWAAKSSTDSGQGNSASACVTVPYHYPSCDSNRHNCDTNPPRDCKWLGTCPNQTIASYGVVPSTSHIGGDVAMVGETIKFKYSMSNNSPYTKTKPMNYRSYIFVVRGDQTIANMGGARSYNSNTNICTGGARSISTNQLRSGTPCVSDVSGTVVIQSGDAWNGPEKAIVLNDSYGQIQPGDQVCSYVTLDNWNVINGESSPSTVASNVSCVRVGKKPQLQINGGDSYAKDGFIGSSYANLATNINHGSYSQYGLMTGDGSIVNFGSAGYTNIADTNKAMACRLAYANSGGFSGGACGLIGKSKLGRLASLPSMPADTIDFSSNNVSIQQLVDGRPEGSYSFRYTGNGSLTIRESKLPAGYHISVYSNKPVVVNGDIVFGARTSAGDSGETAGYTSLSQMPSFNLIVSSGNVDISSNVSLLAGVYVVSNGSFKTCQNATNDDLGIIDECSSKLKIDGAIVSRQTPRLLRTFGSGNAAYVNQWDGNTASSSAEWINYTPNVWLIPNLNDYTLINNYKTTTMNVLPTRF